MEARVEASMGQPLDRKKMWILIIATVIVAAGIGGFLVMRSTASEAKAADQTGAEKEAKAPVPVRVAAVGVAPISSYLSSTANLVAENEVKILAEAEGRISSLLVEEGQRVQKGEALLHLVRGDAQMMAEKARVRAANARVAAARAREMYAQGLLSQGDFEKTSMEKEVAEQELAEGEWRVSKTTVRAPFGGVVTERVVNEGQHMRPGEALFTITDYDPMIARIYLPEKDVLGLSEGREVRLTLRAANEIQFAGRIRQISPVVDTATGTVKITVEAIDPPAAARPGAFVAVDIVRGTRTEAMVLPRESIVRELQEAHVFVADGNVAKKRPVTLGIEEGDVVEVLSGVRPGEKVIVAGQGGLKDGSLIKFEGAPAPAAPTAAGR
ncbi:MAG TPA: efflux RND transporter periplasmic adaptor subunit [Thermoanaerobaculia bacterium]|nr:efflux RND transporter periplasmic adaptor subunit [Thermoanaerobaculia bacterium]